jgi:uncharacterized protein (TIGR02679 family)
LWLSLRSITGDWSVPAGGPVFVCENPTVLEAAADEHGAACAPMVCTDGMPSIAALDLLAGLAGAGRSIRVRADVDDAGFVVVDQVRSVVPDATAWRFDVATYADHLGLSDSDGPADAPGDGDDVDQLRLLYARRGVVVHEEALLDELVGDVGHAAPRPQRIT